MSSPREHSLAYHSPLKTSERNYLWAAPTKGMLRAPPHRIPKARGAALGRLARAGLSRSAGAPGVEWDVLPCRALRGVRALS